MTGGWSHNSYERPFEMLGGRSMANNSVACTRQLAPQPASRSAPPSHLESIQSASSARENSCMSSSCDFFQHNMLLRFQPRLDRVSSKHASSRPQAKPSEDDALETKRTLGTKCQGNRLPATFQVVRTLGTPVPRQPPSCTVGPLAPGTRKLTSMNNDKHMQTRLDRVSSKHES